MSNRENIEAKAEKMVTPIVVNNGFSLYDVEYVKEAGQYYLRVYIDKPGGITIDECEIVSRAFNELLDADDFILDAYIMEISSPGLGRALKKDRHFANSIGEEVVIKTFKAINKQKEFIGILKSFDKESVTIEIEGVDTKFLRSDISSIKLTFDF